MPENIFNKIRVPAQTDMWDLVPDLKKMGESVNAVIAVSSKAERDALTGPGGGAIPNGTVVVRLDQDGVLDRRVGGAWQEGRPAWTSVGGGISYRYFPATGMVEVIVVVTASLPVGVTDLAVAAIPANRRASGGNPRGEALLSSGNMPGQIYVDNTSGNIGCINQSGATRTAVQGRILYSVG
ncbi:hypothetical protein ACFY5D_03735 [Paeniglutamicibacter sp. NPDC012692]|uniref:hypothetical protein n=1 Tax=Paeniglutamicibacter sp. NPDC012692 TaxID=3364388 RepID=UPI0036961034